MRVVAILAWIPLTTLLGLMIDAPLVVPAPAPDPCRGAVSESFSSRCATPLTAQQERGLQPKAVFRECEGCPEMVVVPAGRFTMGSPSSEKDRLNSEGPQRQVTFARPFAVGKFHVTVDQFAAFVAATGYNVGSQCLTFEGGAFEDRSDRSWRNPGFSQAGSHPAVCLNWNDAKAYIEWLSSKTGKSYRLLTEAEWEYAARARTAPGTYPRYWFGNDAKDQCRYANGLDQEAMAKISGTSSWIFAPCNDGYAYTSPVGSFAANGFGLHDMTGNAFQWTADCWSDNYRGAPSDGSARFAGDCNFRALRGGSWDDISVHLRSANRHGERPDDRRSGFGFRVARTL
jgi:formylglycine-generating enzyme required for sulfatase activity